MTMESKPGWRVRHLPMLKWILSRSIVPLLLLIATFNQWHTGVMLNRSLGSLSSHATAKVAPAYSWDIVPDIFSSKRTYENILTPITYSTGSHTIEATITPAALQRLPQKGDHLPVRFDPNRPQSVAYAGASGDTNYPVGSTEFEGALLTLILAAAIFIFYFWRAARIKQIADSSPEVAHEVAAGTEYTDAPLVPSHVSGILQAFSEAMDQISSVGRKKSAASRSETKLWPMEERYQRIRLHGQPGMPDLEWRLLPHQPPVPHTIFIHGRIGYRRWLVVRLLNGTYLWPASRTEPVIGSEMPDLPEDSLNDILSAQRQLLAAYSQLIKGVKQLPFMIHIPPGDGAREWWYTGVLRPVARSFIEKHVSAHAQSLADAFIVSSVSNPDSKDDRRMALADAGQECSSLAGTLRPRARIWDKISLVLGLVVPFVAIPQLQPSVLHKEGRIAFIIADFLLLLIGLLPTLIYIRSARYARRVFRPSIYDRIGSHETSASPPHPNPDATDTLKPINYLEQRLFQAMFIRRPVYWLMQPWVSWAVLGLYVAGILSYVGVTFHGYAIGWAAFYCVVGIALLNSGRILAWLDALRNRFRRT